MADSRIEHADTDPMVLELPFADMRRVINAAREMLQRLKDDRACAITPAESKLLDKLYAYTYRAQNLLNPTTTI